MTTQDEMKKPKLDSSKLYGYTIAGAGTIIILVIVILILYSLLSNGTSHGSAKTESVDVYLDKWITIKTDPKKESLSFDPELEGVDWEVVVNGDFENPIPVTREKKVQHLGNNTKQLDVKLLESSHSGKATFILKRIPK